MNRAEFKHIIAFCVLMQGGQGIRSKHPDYVLEKFKHAEDFDLDDHNQALYHFYLMRYGVDEMDFEDD